jgi:hypothetical protein
VILLADHAQTRVEHPLPLAEALGSQWRVLQPNGDPAGAELAVSPIARAAAVYVLGERRRAARRHAEVRARLREIDGVELFAWLSGDRAVVERDGSELRFRRGSGVVDRRGVGWVYPDALARLWSALRAPYAGDLLISAAPGYELVDWGGVTHCPGGSHGALRADDSLAPLVLCGLEPGTEATREQWALCDVADLVLDHFGIGERRDSLRVHRPAGTWPAFEVGG